MGPRRRAVAEDNKVSTERSMMECGGGGGRGGKQEGSGTEASENSTLGNIKLMEFRTPNLWREIKQKYLRD